MPVGAEVDRIFVIALLKAWVSLTSRGWLIAREVAMCGTSQTTIRAAQ
jgi:hypothetical protein